jgi:lysophospholipase L1-like esterase
VLLEGVNDLGFSQLPDDGCSAPNTNVTPDQLIRAYRQVIQRMHAHGLRIYGGTLLPFQGASYWDAAAEQKRQAVNDWIRHGRAFDAVVDFDAALRDPADQARYLPAYDCGDHLHPSDAGYQAMADAIDLRTL